jgi:SAM-dependent methyltransferase
LHYRAWLARNWAFFCPVCEDKVAGFLPLPAFYREQFAKHGSDLRIEDGETCNYKGYSCPNCGASDRDRLYALYLDKRLAGTSLDGFRLLDIAPAEALSKHIRRKHRLLYRTADLYMAAVDDRVDITRMDCYPDAHFDAFICSHVLEHIPDDKAAMSELSRILKPGGWGIVMVPLSPSIRELREDPTITTEAERWKYFGQNDHVRYYTRDDFLQRLRSAGFKIFMLKSDFFGEEKFVQCGISRQSVLYVVEK